MRKQRADMTQGDCGVPIIGVANEVLTGKTIEFEIIKPSGNTLRQPADSVSGYNANYHTIEGDLDEDWEYEIYLYDRGEKRYYTNESGNIFTVRQKPADMARG